MATRHILAGALAFGLSTAASATDLDDLTDAEREAFRAEVRAYLLENPEVLMEAIAVLEERQAAEEMAAATLAITDNSDIIYNSAFDFVDGNPDGDIVVVEFLDYRCGFCRRAHPQVDALLEQDTGIRLVVKEFPILGEQSLLASRFAIATRVAFGDEAYATMHDALMDMRSEVTERSLRRIAERYELDADRILATMDDPIVAQTIETNHQIGRQLGITGTPSFLFQDSLIRGFVPLDGMQEIIADLRENAG